MNKTDFLLLGFFFLSTTQDKQMGNFINFTKCHNQDKQQKEQKTKRVLEYSQCWGLGKGSVEDTLIKWLLE